MSVTYRVCPHAKCRDKSRSTDLDKVTCVVSNVVQTCSLNERPMERVKSYLTSLQH